MIEDSPLHPAVEPLAFLLGRWEGTALGVWVPERLRFVDHVEFGHVGKPFLTYRQQTWREDGVASHGEAGYLAVGDGGLLTWTVAQPSGIVEVHTGSLEGQRIELTCAAIGLGPDAKPVTSVGREISLEGDELRYRIRIGMNDEPLADHIDGRLRRVAAG